MNEKIKDILKKVKGETYIPLGLTTRYGTQFVHGMNEDELEKFAKLIVKECINLVENEAAQYADPVWAVELVNDIKEHFGVEDE